MSHHLEARHDHSHQGAVLRWPRLYDLLVNVITFGRERALREQMLDAAGLREGEHVLDIGCGTGTLAIAAKRRVGPTGTVQGFDASEEMIARARAKAAKAGLAVSVDVAPAERLPVPDESVDVAFCTLVLHHLAEGGPPEAVAEMRRVLRPGGRVVIAELAPAPGHSLNPITWIHGHETATSMLREAEALLTRQGFVDVRVGDLGVRGMGSVAGRRP